MWFVLQTTSGLSLVSGTYRNGEIKCTFTRRKNVTGTNEDGRIFNLVGQDYYVLLGVGGLKADGTS